MSNKKIVRRYEEKMDNKYILGIFVLSIVAILAVSMVSAFGFGKGFMGNGMIKENLTDEEKTAMQEQQQAMQEAITNKDYSAWKTLMEEKIAEMQAQITEENFNSIVAQHEKMSEIETLRGELRQAVKDKDTAKVEELKSQLSELVPEENFERGMARGPGMRSGKGMDFEAKGPNAVNTGE